MRVKELRERCTFWQNRLKLQDWDVLVKVGRLVEHEPDYEAGEMPHTYEGLACWSTEEAKCLILISPKSPDRERTLKHELLHLRLEGHQDPKKYDDQYERAINALVDAL